MTLADTHCHLDMRTFDADRQSVIQRAMDAGVTRILVPGLSAKSSRDALALAEAQRPVYAAVGFHPTEVRDLRPHDLDWIAELTQHAKLVAVGEIGLDYYWTKDAERRALQRQAFETQLSFASRSGLPVVLHMREESDAEDAACSRDLLSILGNWVASLRSENAPLAQRPGVLHSFSGGENTASKAIELGFYIGITGPVTHRNASRRRQVVSALPLDRVLLETDSPFQAPEPHRGLRNEPAFVSCIADRIAEIHSRPPAEIAELTSSNAARLFGWGEIA